MGCSSTGELGISFQQFRNITQYSDQMEKLKFRCAVPLRPGFAARGRCRWIHGSSLRVMYAGDTTVLPQRCANVPCLRLIMRTSCIFSTRLVRQDSRLRAGLHRGRPENVHEITPLRRGVCAIPWSLSLYGGVSLSISVSPRFPPLSDQHPPSMALPYCLGMSHSRI